MLAADTTHLQLSRLAAFYGLRTQTCVGHYAQHVADAPGNVRSSCRKGRDATLSISPLHCVSATTASVELRLYLSKQCPPPQAPATPSIIGRQSLGRGAIGLPFSKPLASRQKVHSAVNPCFTALPTKYSLRHT